MNKDLILREKLALQRTKLANQSTFLAFIRTSMYFLVAGISIKNLTSVNFAMVYEIVFIAVSIVLLTIGVFNYNKQIKLIKESEIHIGNFQDDYKKSKS